MKNYLLRSFIGLIFISLTSCITSKKEPYKIPENAIELITGTSGKTWKIAKRYNGGTRMNMGDCFLSYRITYLPDMTAKDNNDDHHDCGPSLIANWEISTNEKGNSFIKLTSDQLPKLMGVEKNYKFFKITYLNKDTLQLRFKHKQFSSTSRIIVDTYVQEDIIVKNRDFHNK
ncbi:lipocalin family protein [Aquimarina sp. 2201CG5-10]|uniref:lipocalin family protein n=1 Tax=Aquimarina callyspongiae TaxID=3098150 RepID=UPI002AB374B8|nr:lipocalin family protein [Aquimarina sp. 2201CG5-10]MDY8138166.1 lipocalin family protein [Aquimarina sp. 2201CG5-10]